MIVILDMKEVKYKTGSRAFFDGIEEFTPHDQDWLIFNTSLNTNIVISLKGETIFKWKTDKADEIINILLNQKFNTNGVCMLLIPEIIEVIGMTFDKLPKIKPLIDKLDDKHKYIEVIYNAYLENGKFELTKEQLNSAYEEYKRERPNIYNK